MLIVTTENITGHDPVQSMGEVFGAVGNSMAGSRSISGGEIPEHTRRIEQARQPALGQMHCDSKEIAANMSESVAYSTAVVTQVPA